MTTTKLAYTLWLALFGSQASAMSNCGLTAEHAAVMLYEKHRDFLFVPNPDAPLTDSFAKLVARNTQNQGEVGPIDWDFWTNAQDGDASPEAKAIRTERAGKSSTVVLQYTFTLDPSVRATPIQTRVLVEERSRDCWVVNDLVHQGKSARSLLQQRPKR